MAGGLGARIGWRRASGYCEGGPKECRPAAVTAGCGAFLQATVRYVRAMHADTQAVRAIMEKMSADIESKTTWIPTGVRPPAWLAGKK